MEVYYIEAEIFENIMDRIENLSTHVDHLCKKTEEKKLGEWMDNQDVCLRLNISPRTLQTLRDTGKLAYSQIQHKIYYKAEDVEKLVTYVGLKRKEKILREKRTTVNL